jgi:hypothetical protein
MGKRPAFWSFQRLEWVKVASFEGSNGWNGLTASLGAVPVAGMGERLAFGSFQGLEVLKGGPLGHSTGLTLSSASSGSRRSQTFNQRLN